MCAFFHEAAAQDATSGKKKLAQPALELLDAKPADSPGKIVEDFFTLLGRNQIDQAYDQLVHGTVIESNKQQMDGLKSKTREAVQLFGEIRGQEIVTVKNVGTHLMCSTYVSLGKIFPLRWKFYFYKSDKAWRLIDIRVDDRLSDMFDEKTPPASAAPAAQ
jgi:hypothetical protein